MTPGVLSFPFAVSQRDPSGLFAIQTTVVAWREDHREAEGTGAITLTLGAGTLHDADKGPFPLDGLELAMRIANGRIAPSRVLEPGALSELQQEALLDAVSTALNAGGRLFPQLARRYPS
jgi:hypothetical protein